MTWLSEIFRIRLLLMAIRWVYLPRYSIALPAPLNVSLMKGIHSFWNKELIYSFQSYESLRCYIVEENANFLVSYSWRNLTKNLPRNFFERTRIGIKNLEEQVLNSREGVNPPYNNAVNMRVEIQLLSPGMQNLDHSWLCTKIFWIWWKFHDCLCNTGMK